VLPDTFWPIWRTVANLLHAVSTTPGDHLCEFEGAFQDTYQPVQTIVLVHLQNWAHLHQLLVPQQFAELGQANVICLHTVHCCLGFQLEKQSSELVLTLAPVPVQP